MELALAAAEAKLRADSAAVRRVMAELERLREPTKSDTAQVMTLCGQAAPPGLVKEWLDLKAQLEELQRLEREAQAAVRQAETSASGMTDRQLAVACERIKQFVDQSRRKAAKGGFTAGESQALAQAIKDLEDLCP
jgi:hypothetical protein